MTPSISNVAHQIQDRFNRLDLSEGDLTRRIENQTAKIPSVTFLNLALGSIVLSAGLNLFGKKPVQSNFVGLWAPTFLLIGIYNKLVKLEGNDRQSRPRRRNSVTSGAGSGRSAGRSDASTGTSSERSSEI